MVTKKVTIGVISDTHIPSKVRRLPEFLLEKLSGVDLIIHAGDIVQEGVLAQLKEIAPVQAVSGNVDSPELKQQLPEVLKFETAGYRIGVTHGHNIRGNLLSKLPYLFAGEDIIIFGHTHRPFNERIAGKLLFNPGSPTDRRLQPYHTFGMIYLGNIIKSEIIEIRRDKDGSI